MLRFYLGLKVGTEDWLTKVRLAKDGLAEMANSGPKFKVLLMRTIDSKVGY